MQIISKTDAIFAGFHALLIPLLALLVFFASGQAIALLVVPPLLALYLWLALRRPLRRLRAARRPLPPSWHEFLISHSAYFRGLDGAGKMKFARDIALFLSEDNVVAIHGAPLSWQTRLLVGAGVATMLHGRPEWEPPLPDGVTVYPGASFDRNYRPGTGNIAGQAPERGPLLIAEEGLKQGVSDHAAGRNVLLHELAHFFDRERRKSFAGYPQAHGGTWADFWTAQWRQHLRQGSILPDYAAVNEAEFFAVACEMFFEQPARLHAAHPVLFERLREFFNQDPRRILF
jgi:hypothetical protein